MEIARFLELIVGGARVLRRHDGVDRVRSATSVLRSSSAVLFWIVSMRSLSSCSSCLWQVPQASLMLSSGLRTQ